MGSIRKASIYTDDSSAYISLAKRRAAKLMMVTNEKFLFVLFTDLHRYICVRVTTLRAKCLLLPPVKKTNAL